MDTEHGSTVLLEGTLEKKSKHLKHWRKRFFRLRRGILQYYVPEDVGRQELRQAVLLKDVLTVELVRRELVVVTCTDSAKREMRLRGDDIETWADMVEAARTEAQGGVHCGWCDDEDVVEHDPSATAEADRLTAEIGSDIVDTLVQSTGFSPDGVRDIFHRMESISAGRVLGKQELARILQELSGRPEPCVTAAELLHVAFDRDRSGYIDFPDLVSGLAVLIGQGKKERLDMLFSSFDLDGDGFIVRSEVERVVSAIFKVGGGVEGVWGGQHRDVPPEADREYAMFKNVLDRLFEGADGDAEKRISRGDFDTCFQDFNQMIPQGAIPGSKEFASWLGQGRRSGPEAEQQVQ
mmetsp:Transcript_60124/g.167761  ORF Transcript_60124/g.167761 Transcript_60124/m.167761 type:complete len:351 (-) Transcript_60124:98-1150(-)